MDTIWRDTSPSGIYEEARIARVFNTRRPKHQPTAIFHVTSKADIIKAVQVAREKKLLIAVRSGGHSYSTWSLHENSILIDLGNYCEYTVDVERSEAWVSSGLRSNIDLELMEKYGLMLGAGHHPDVGLGGYFLQGGLSWKCRSWGWACERLKGLDVVTADGRLVHCSSQENSDLFWAARGSGPFFPGIVTQFQVQLLPAPKCFRSSCYIFRKDQYREVFTWALDLTPTLDEDTEIIGVCRYPEGIDELCFILSFITMKGSPEAARDALLRAHKSRPKGAIQELFCQEDYLDQLYATEVREYPGNRRWLAENTFIQNDADVVTALEDICTRLPDRRFVVLWYALFPQSRRKLPDMAFSLQSDHYVGTYAIYEDADDDEECSAWLRGAVEKLEPVSLGSFTGESDFAFRKGKYWGDDQAEKLTQIRQRWDPEGQICAPLGYGKLEYIH